MKQETILITGGSGLIGQHMANELQKKGYEIRILSRKKSKNDNSPFKSYYWNIDSYDIDAEAVKNADFIVHLAGENISEKRWTNKQKIIIENSRVKSAELLYKAFYENDLWPKAFISSSAIGYYGTFKSEQILTEDSSPGNDFLGKIGKKWEAAADMFEKKGVRTVKIRTGVVLSKDGAAYPKMAKPSKFGLAAAFGSGKQYVPWIHIDDIVNIFTKAIEDNNMKGIYNGVAPEYLTNKQLTKAIAKGLGKPYFMPNIPSFLLRAAFGKMADILLKGSRVSAEKIIESGFEFKYPDIEAAMKELVQ
jgi:uncharacterized protein (TIGR01777 family)